MDLSRIYNTIDFIEKNYHNTLSIKDLENVSCYSYRNIQRIFKCTCQETIGAFQKRLKLENAYKMILYTKISLSNIAYDVGFESLAAFSKAFKLQFGISPKEARINKTLLFQAHTFIPKVTESAIKPTIEYLAPQKVYYKSVYTDYNNPVIEKLWKNVMQMGFQEQNAAYYGVIVDEPLITEKLKCRYDACCNMPPSKEQLPEKTILGGKYAKFIHSGSYDTIEDTYSKIYANWILTTELEFTASPIIEQYIKHESNTIHENEYETAILIPLNL